jgi:hypothetical protein
MHIACARGKSHATVHRVLDETNSMFIVASVILIDELDAEKGKVQEMENERSEIAIMR